jgi:O-methyltransferase involved in polyketide biosynthesis
VLAVPGDARDPKAILADPDLNQLIDFTAPVCIVLCGVLHFLDYETARETAATLIKAIAPGSFLVLSVGVGDAELAKDFAAAYRASNLHIFSPGEFASFFEGLTVEPPGLVPAQDWIGGQPLSRQESREASFLVGVGRKQALQAEGAQP